MTDRAARHDLRQIDVKENIAPLRKVMQTTYNEVGLEFDLLECGHLVMAPTDYTGHSRSAARRRCRFCGERMSHE